MRREDIKYLACPICRGGVTILRAEEQNKDDIKTGILQCRVCTKEYNIVQHIPRFAPLENYAKGFGLEWMMHAKTQYDSYSSSNISEIRFFNETGWPRRMEGQIILEVGSGSGRFTQQAASTGAMVISMDLSCAVDANYASNGNMDNVLIVQADICNMPFRENLFDRIFCFGVLQHVPDVNKAFMRLPICLKKGGNLAIDVYAKKPGVKGLLARLLATKYWVRPLTKNIEPKKLYVWCKRYVEFMWPVAKLINRIPFLGKSINWRLLIGDYKGIYPLSEKILKEWAVLDAFDMLSPHYDFPQSIETVQQWFKDAKLDNVDIHYGYNGIEGRGVKR